MGVQRLTTYIHNECPETYGQHSIDKIVQYAVHHDNKKPIIVVDLNASIRCFYKFIGNLDFICGGQTRQLYNCVKEIISKFDEIGIRLIFVIDGPKPLNSEIRIKKGVKILNDCVYPTMTDLKWDVDPRCTDRDSDVLTYGSIFRVLIEDPNVETIVADGDADPDVVSVAIKKNAAGILSRDSDYIIFDLKCVYFNAEFLNMENMTARVYDRFTLTKKYLKLKSTFHLPLFAIFAGNSDIDRMIYLRNFQSYLFSIYRTGLPKTKSISDYFDTIVNFINSQKFSQYSKERVIYKIRHIIENLQVFDSNKVDMFINAYKYYFVRDLKSIVCLPSDYSDDTWSRILRLPFCHDNVTMIKYNYFEISQGFEFHDPEGIPSVDKLTTDIRRRHYQVAFYESNDKEITILELIDFEYIKVNGPREINPGTLDTKKVLHPGLLQLHYGEDMQDFKLNLFIYVFFGAPGESSLLDENEINEFKTMAAKEGLLFITTSLLILQRHYEFPILYDWEILTFILHFCLIHSCTLDELNLIDPNDIKLTARSVQLAHVYQNYFIYTTSNLIGNVVPVFELLGPYNFDGVLFQYLYSRASNGRCRNVQDIALEYPQEYVDVEKINRIFNFVTQNRNERFFKVAKM